MRICLITPGHLSTNPRAVKEADALVDAGHDVTVLASSYQSQSRDADVAFDSRSWRRAPPVQFGPDSPRRNRATQVVRHKLARALFVAGSRHRAIVAAACHPAAPELTSAARRIPADLYIAHYIAALPAAAAAARLHRSHYAFDAEDFHTGEFKRATNSDRAVVTEVERQWLSGCVWVTAASPGIADAYAETYGLARPTVVLNVFPRSEAPDAPTSHGAFSPGPSIYWFSQTIGPDRGLEQAVRAIARTQSRPHLVLRGQPAKLYAEALAKLASLEGVADRLHILPTAPGADMARLAALHDLGLSAETGHTRNRQVALTNKLFTYVLAGIPTIMSDIEAHRHMAPVLSNAAVLYREGDPESLAEAMDRLLLDPKRLEHARTTAFQLGQEQFNWEIEKTKLVALANQFGRRQGAS